MPIFLGDDDNMIREAYLPFAKLEADASDESPLGMLIVSGTVAHYSLYAENLVKKKKYAGVESLEMHELRASEERVNEAKKVVDEFIGVGDIYSRYANQLHAPIFGTLDELARAKQRHFIASCREPAEDTFGMFLGTTFNARNAACPNHQDV